MEPILTEVEARVLGSLIEKQLATPEYYPMSVNSLAAACNQKTNREPVVEYSEDDVRDALEALRDKGLSAKIYGPSVRVPKHRHLADQKWNLPRPELAALAVLMLRGPQTLGEIRGRGERLHNFADLGEVEAVLQKMMERKDGPLVVKLPRQSGRRDERYAHLLCGEPPAGMTEETASGMPAEGSRPTSRRSEGAERIGQLEQRVEGLQEEMQALRETFEEFRKSFQ